MPKGGRLGKDEWDFIEEHGDTMSPEDIAAKLDRNVAPVLNYLRKIGKDPNKVENYVVQAEHDLKSRPVWNDIRQQFDSVEQGLFLYHWSQIVAQFQGDILSTEELQIIDAVKLEILMNRALKQHRALEIQIEEFNDLIQAEYKMHRDERDVDGLFNMEKQVAIKSAAQKDCMGNYKIFQEKKNAILKEMKGTREQRISQITSNKKTFGDIAVRMQTDKEWVRQKNIELETYRIALRKEEERLGDFHEYIDGEVDQPYLSSENVILE